MGESYPSAVMPSVNSTVPGDWNLEFRNRIHYQFIFTFFAVVFFNKIFFVYGYVTSKTPNTNDSNSVLWFQVTNNNNNNNNL